MGAHISEDQPSSNPQSAIPILVANGRLHAVALRSLQAAFAAAEPVSGKGTSEERLPDTAAGEAHKVGRSGPARR